jgi:hypothetical protein
MGSTRTAKSSWPKPFFKTGRGRLFLGNSEDMLTAYPLTRQHRKVQLILTSPPFALNRKKKYGNEIGEEYVRWLASYASILGDYLTDDGSLVIELGNGWTPGQPTMSTLPLEALLAFKNEGNFELCQEFICFNPARLPSPAQWVTVKRTRVKDALTRVWWMSRTPHPKADNRRVLTEYSESMKKLLKRGTYNSGNRPSEHNIGATSFLEDNGGAIAANVLVPSIEDIVSELIQAQTLLSIANTRTNDAYQLACKEMSLTPHPARMPAKLVEFFVKFLTDEGDLVLDPFAGSNTTGAVAESLRRRWLCIEAEQDYALGAAGRFSGVEFGEEALSI